MDSGVSQKSARVSTVALAGALLLAAAMGIGRFAYTPLLPPMQGTLGWTAPHAGDVASSNFFGYLAGALAATSLTQRPERLSWLLTGMVLSAATTSAGAVAVSFPISGWQFASSPASQALFVLFWALPLSSSFSQSILGRT